MLKITRIADDELSITLQLEGKLIGSWVDELQLVCEQCQAQRRETILDVADLRFADDQGVRALRALRGKRIRMRGASSFLTELLAQPQND